jgi:hypothetical protein
MVNQPISAIPPFRTPVVSTAPTWIFPLPDLHDLHMDVNADAGGIPCPYPRILEAPAGLNVPAILTMQAIGRDPPGLQKIFQDALPWGGNAPCQVDPELARLQHYRANPQEIRWGFHSPTAVATASASVPRSATPGSANSSILSPVRKRWRRGPASKE